MGLNRQAHVIASNFMAKSARWYVLQAIKPNNYLPKQLINSTFLKSIASKVNKFDIEI